MSAAKPLFTPEALRGSLFFAAYRRKRRRLNRLSQGQYHVPFFRPRKSTRCAFGKRCDGLRAQIPNCEAAGNFTQESAFIVKYDTAGVDDLARLKEKTSDRSLERPVTGAFQAYNRIGAGWKNRCSAVKGNRIAEKASPASGIYANRFLALGFRVYKNPA